MTDFAQLGLEIDSTSADKASASLDRLEASASKVEQTYEGVGKRLEKAGVTMEEMNRRAAAWAAQQQAANEETRKGASDTEKFVRQLQIQAETLGMTRAQLAAYKASKMEFNDEQALSVAQSLVTIEKYEQENKALHGLFLGSERARNAIGNLTQALLRGDFPQASRSLGQFVASSRLSFSTIASVVLPISAAVGSVIALGKAYNDGEKEVIAMNRALLASNNYAGMTRDSMRELAAEVAKAGNMTMGTGKELVTQLAGSGQIGAGAMAPIAALAGDFAATMGQDVDKVGKDLVRLFADPAKGAEELNKQMHILSPAQLEHIRQLQEIGRLGDAQLYLAQQISPHIKGQADQLGYLGRAWAGVKDAASSAWDAMMGLGRPKSVEEEIRDVEERLRRMRGGLLARTPGGQQNIARVELELEQLRMKLAGQREQAAVAAGRAEENRLQNQASALVDQTSKRAQLLEIENKISLARQFVATTTQDELDKQRAIEALQKQRADIIRGFSQEQRQIAQEETQHQQRVAEAMRRGEAQQIEGLYKIGKITQEERDKRLLANDLIASAEKQLNIENQLQVGNLSKLEQARLRNSIQLLEEERRIRIANYETARAIAEAQRTAAQATADANSSQSTARGQIGEIESMIRYNETLRQRQKELGLTREQVDMLRQAEIQMAIARLELEASEITGTGVSEDDPYILRLRRQIELLKERAALEMGTDTTSEQEARFTREMEGIRKAREEGILTQQEYDQMELEIRSRHEWELTGIANRGMTERFRFMQMSGLQQTKFMIGMLAEMTSSAAQHNRTLFEINKVASTANAIVKGWEAVQAAFAFGNSWGGPIAGAAMAAIAAATAAVNVAAIQSTSFGAGGGGSMSGGMAAPVAPATAALPEPARQQQTTIVQVRGDDMFSGRNLATLFDKINESTKDGGRILVVEERR